jgi:hypothetical protein
LDWPTSNAVHQALIDVLVRSPLHRTPVAADAEVAVAVIQRGASRSQLIAFHVELVIEHHPVAAADVVDRGQVEVRIGRKQPGAADVVDRIGAAAGLAADDAHVNRTAEGDIGHCGRRCESARYCQCDKTLLHAISFRF